MMEMGMAKVTISVDEKLRRKISSTIMANVPPTNRFLPNQVYGAFDICGFIVNLL